MSRRYSLLGSLSPSSGGVITFFVGWEEYHADKGMTWEQFIYSSYNPARFRINGEYVYNNHGATIYEDNTHVLRTSIIIPNKIYAAVLPETG